MINMHTLSNTELRTIIEDAFIDGWHQAEAMDYYAPEWVLEDEDNACETAVVLRNLRG